MACVANSNLNRLVKISHPIMALASEKRQKWVEGVERILGKDEKQASSLSSVMAAEEQENGKFQGSTNV